MELVRRLYRSLNLPSHRLNIRIFSPMFSSMTVNPQSTNESLMHRLRKVLDPEASIHPILDEWNKQVRYITRKEGSILAIKLKHSKRYIHALQIFEWMDLHCSNPMRAFDAAHRINIISMAHGIDQAEKFFDNLPSNLKRHTTYGALLGSFAAFECVIKAEDFFREMKELGFVKKCFPYNMMIILYGKTGKFNRLDAILDEMEKAGFPIDSITLKDYMSACVAKLKFSRIEKIIDQIRRDPSLATWEIFTIAARGYLNAGNKEYACIMLTHAEYILPKINRDYAISYLTFLHARADNREGVIQCWARYRGQIKRISVYATMVSSFVMVDDFEGAEEVFWEWNEKCRLEEPYDFRVLNPIIDGYCRKGLLKEAESILLKANALGRTSYVKCWEALACEYAEGNDMKKAVELMKRGMEVGRQWWKPSSVILKRCLAHLNARGDEIKMNEFNGLIRKSWGDVLL